MPVGGSPKDVLPDPVLTGLAVELGSGPGYVADIIAPVAQVSNDVFKYSVWDREDIKNDVRADRAPGTPANEVVMSKTYTTGEVKPRSLKMKLPDELRNNDPNPEKLEARRTKILTGKLKLIAELNIAAALVAATKTQTAPSVKWDAASPTIRADILAAKNAFRRNCGFNPTHLVLPPNVSSAVFNNSQILELVKYTKDDILKYGVVPMIENMDVITPGAVRDTSNPGAAKNIADIYTTDEAYMLYVDPEAGNDLEGAMTALRQVRSLASVSTPYSAYKWRDADASAHADVVAVDCNQVEIVTAQELILRILDVLT